MVGLDKSFILSTFFIIFRSEMERINKIRENLTPNFHVEKAVNQVVPNAVVTTITWDNVVGEDMGEMNLITERFEPIKERCYVISLQLRVDGLAIGSWLYAEIAGVAINPARAYISGTNVRQSVSLVWTGYAATGQFPICQVLHNDVGGVNVIAANCLWTIACIRQDGWRY